MAEQLVAELRRALPAEIQVAGREGHLYAWRPDTLDMPLDEIHRLTLSGDNGELLGYGVRRMDLFGTVLVLVTDPSGQPVAGFYSEATVAEQYAVERTQDFTDAIGPGFTYSIIE